MLVSHASSHRIEPAPLWLPARIDGVEVDAFELYAIDATTKVQRRRLRAGKALAQKGQPHTDRDSHGQRPLPQDGGRARRPRDLVAGRSESTAQRVPKRASDQWSFAASEKQLRGVFEEVLPDPSPTKDIVIDTIFPRFADERSNTTDGPTGAGGRFKEIRVNILEVWAAFAIVCIGSIEDKLSFIFDLFDFNHQKSLSHTEVMVLFGTTLTGITKYARRGEPPDSDTLTEWSDALYDSYKKDYRTRVSKDQVCSYYMKTFTETMRTERSRKLPDVPHLPY